MNQSKDKSIDNSSRAVRYLVTLCASLLMIGIMTVIHFNDVKEEKHIKVGFIYISDINNPYTYNFIRAQKAIEETYGDQVETIVEYNVLEGNEGAAIERLVEAKCDLIFGISYGYSTSLKEAAIEHPEIIFCAATADNMEDPIVENYHSFMGRIYEGRYVSGIVAGLKIKELIDAGKINPENVTIGYVGAFPYAEVISGYTAFYLGVKEIVPNVTMRVKYTNSWSDYAKEKKLAKELIEENCVVISQHSDTYGPAVACEEAVGKHIVYHVGYNQSMFEVAPTTSLVSCRINWNPYMVAAVGAVLEDQDIESCQDAIQFAQDACAGFDYGWVEMMELNEVIVSEETKEQVERYIQEFREHPHSIFIGDYQGTNPFDESDVIDLTNGYEENAFRSAPSFGYVLDDIIIE